MKRGKYGLLAALVVAGGIGLLLLALTVREKAPRREASPAAARLAIAKITAIPGEVEAGGASVITVTLAGEDARRGPLRLAWEVSGGAIEGSGKVVKWQAPTVVGPYLVTVKVTDGAESATARTYVRVRLPSPQKTSGPYFPVARAAPPGPDVAARIHELETVLATPPAADAPMVEHIAAKHRRIELAGLLLRSARYREALALYAGLIDEMAADDPNSGPYRAGFGRAALQLGREDEALAALQDAGRAFTTAEDQYTIGSLLEKRGLKQEALGAYETAMAGNVAWPPDTLYRRAELLIADGRTHEAVEVLVAFSPVTGREDILARLHEDPELGGVLAALEGSGRLGELEAARAVDPQTLPGAEPPPDQPLTIVYPIPGVMKEGYEQ